jgi:hypothetical protein
VTKRFARTPKTRRTAGIITGPGCGAMTDQGMCMSSPGAPHQKGHFLCYRGVHRTVRSAEALGAPLISRARSTRWLRPIHPLMFAGRTFGSPKNNRRSRSEKRAFGTRVNSDLNPTDVVANQRSAIFTLLFHSCPFN